MIPKIIHYCWIGEKPLPLLAQKCIASWQKIMPDYKIQRWDERNYDFQKNKFMVYAYKCKKWGFVPDYARLDIIYNYGGIYLDTDVETIKSFDNFLKYPAFCGFESQHFINFGLGFGAEKGNQVIKNLMQSYNFQTEDWEKNAFVPSPIIQTRFLVENYGLKQNNTRQSLYGIEVFPSSYFCPKNYSTGKLNCTIHTVTIHHFMASWLSKKSLLRLKLRRLLINYFPSIFIDKILLILKKFR